jgi:hypothetical protein
MMRVKRAVTRPAYDWGAVTHDSIGVFVGLDPDGDWVVDFPGNESWHGLSHELEVDARAAPNCPAAAGPS